MILIEQLKKIIPTNKETAAWLEVLTTVLPKYGVNTPLRLAGFLAQTAHESGDFKSIEENLNYSAEGLIKTWPTRFNTNNTKAYARKPEAIANKVYADRMGNGNEASGDGWKFRGRGIKQLTGRDNYTQFAKAIGITAEEATEYCSTKRGAVESAAWFWKTNNLNRFADADDIVGLTKAINGGTIGLADRKKKYSIAKTVLSSNAKPSIKDIRRRDTGEMVKAIQKALGVEVDGIFGIGTEISLRQWQADNNLEITGIVTPEIYSRLVK